MTANDDLYVKAMFYRKRRCDSQSHILYDSLRAEIVCSLSTYSPFILTVNNITKYMN